MRQLICGNWKMFGSVAETAVLVKALRASVDDVTNVDLAVAPPYPFLSTARELLSGSPIMLAAQNCHWENQGAFTGEVSPAMLRDVGCRWVIVGHSERRLYFDETDETVNRRTKGALRESLTPIVCVGETLAQREGGNTLAIVERQIRIGLEGLTPTEIVKLVIAYEPVWAIGTGRVASAAQAQEVHEAIRMWLPGHVARTVRILYGGSVKGDNAAELLAQPDVDGALVGGASLKADEFARIVWSVPATD